MPKRKRGGRSFRGLNVGKRGVNQDDRYWTQLHKEMGEQDYLNRGAYSTSDPIEPIRLDEGREALNEQLKRAFQAGWYSHANGGTSCHEDWYEYFKDNLDIREYLEVPDDEHTDNG